MFRNFILSQEKSESWFLSSIVFSRVLQIEYKKEEKNTNYKKYSKI